MTRLLVRIAMTGLALVAAHWTLLFFAQRSLLYPAPSPVGAPVRPSDARQIWLPADAGPVEAWLLPPDPPVSSPAPLLLLTHGNAELIDHLSASFKEARRWGMAVLLVEYPGYGRSAGSPSQESITWTILAAYDWAGNQPDIDPARIIPYGRSLGGGAACIVAVRRRVPAIILESTFTSIRPFAARYGAPGFLVRDPFDNLEAIKAFGGPSLILHGDNDTIVPARHGVALAAASAGARLVQLPCGHGYCPPIWPHIHDFLEGHGLLDHPAPSSPRE